MGQGGTSQAECRRVCVRSGKGEREGALLGKSVYPTSTQEAL